MSLTLVMAMVSCVAGPMPADSVSHLLTGVVSSDAPLAGTVTLKDSSEPAREVAVSLNSVNAFQFDTSGLKGPFLLKADAADGTHTDLHAVSEGGTTNINPLTNALVSGAAGGVEPAVVYDQPSPGKTKETAENLATLSDELKLALAPLFAEYGITDPVADASIENEAGLRALVQDVRIGVANAYTYVTNRATGAVVYVGPSADPAAGSFYAANMPTAPESLRKTQPAPTSPTPTEPAPVVTPTPSPTPTTTPTPAPTPVTCSYVYSTWGACEASGTQSRALLSTSPALCVGTPVLTQSCAYVPPPPPPACTYTYSSWSACQSNNTQTRTVTASSPVGCVGTPTLTQSCTYVAPVTPAPAPAPIPAPATGLVYPPDTKMVKLQQPSASEPALGSSIVNTFGLLGGTFETVTTRVADYPHHYPKDSVWNSDESFAITANRRLLDGKTYAYIRTVVDPGGLEHDTWSNVNPRYIYGARRDYLQWVRVDVVANTWTALKTYTATDVGLSSLSKMSFGEYEGNISNDDSGVVLVANDVRPVLVNAQTGAVRCYVTSGGGYGNTVSDATISQDGRWIIVNWLNHGVDAYNASDCSFARQLTNRNSHYDACVSTAGEQVIVQASPMQMVRLSDGTATTIYNDTWFPAHVSCRNTARPGWVYISSGTTSCDSTFQNHNAFHRVFAVKLDGSQTIENFAWDHEACPTLSSGDDTTEAVPSRNGNRVWWKARWDGATSGIHSFVAEKR